MLSRVLPAHLGDQAARRRLRENAAPLTVVPHHVRARGTQGRQSRRPLCPFDVSPLSAGGALAARSCATSSR